MDQEKFYLYSRLLSYTIVIPVAIGIVRYKKIDPSFRPFFLLVFFDFFTEILYEVLSRTIETNSISYNFYNLVAFFIIGKQLVMWGLLNSKSLITIFVGAITFIFWVWDNLFLNSLWSFNSYNILLIAVLICLFSIQAISKLSLVIKNEKRRNLVFVIIGIWVSKYIILIVTEISWVSFKSLGQNFFLKTTYLALFAGAIFNLAYALIALWVPKKREFSWLSR
jgi:hypothetical protein